MNVVFRSSVDGRRGDILRAACRRVLAGASMAAQAKQVEGLYSAVDAVEAAGGGDPPQPLVAVAVPVLAFERWRALVTDEPEHDSDLVGTPGGFGTYTYLAESSERTSLIALCIVFGRYPACEFGDQPDEVVRERRAGAVAGQRKPEPPCFALIPDALNAGPAGYDRLLYGHHSIEIGDEMLGREGRNESVSRPATTFDLTKRQGLDLDQRADLHERPTTAAADDVTSLGHDREAADVFLGGVRLIGGCYGGGFGQWGFGVQTEEEPVVPKGTVCLSPRSESLVNTCLAGFIQPVHADGSSRCMRHDRVQDPGGLCRSTRR